MKKIFAIAWKDAIVRFASPSEWLFFIVLPLVFTFIFAGGVPTGDEDNRVRLAVVDEAQTEISRQLIGELEDSTAVRPDVLSLAEAEEEFDSRRVSALLIIPAGLDTESIQNGTAQLDFRQLPNDIDASIAERAVQTAIRRVTGIVSAAIFAVDEAKARGAFESAEAEQAYFNQSVELAKSLQADSPERVTVIQGNTPDDFDYDPQANVSAGQLITWVFIPLFGISALFAYERQQGTLRRILATPTSKATLLLGTISGQVVMALIQMTLLVLFAYFAFKLNWGNPVAVFLILACSALAAAAIGTAMGTFVKSEGQATGLSIMAGMLMGMLGGCWYPIELFPSIMQNIARIFPTTWAMQGLLDLLLRGGGLIDVLPEAGVLLGFAAIFFSVGVWRFRYE
ncbi:MAG TPA: ABC transporter permease [Anaerolineales bacterium]|nr:ABC transporter permease [Anaerolineales bacterium]HMR97868.1 ABC transporter permease [Anaerolineales bacterium]HNQ94212.1 ABC transporter permease [Anaerolineales bacterium]HNS59495.1 ABC transporter permease [Anaerolineales bacterium]